jgi:DNA polymerase-3 subunit alpha
MRGHRISDQPAHRAGHAGDDGYVQRAVRLAGGLRLPVVATHPVQFLAREEFRAHEARVCISQGHMLADQRRPRAFTPEQYFKTQEEMARLFADIPAALTNSVEIARRCSFELELGKSKLPLFPTPGTSGLDDYLRSEATAGLEHRLVALYPEPAQRELQVPRYRQRLELEIATIIEMKTTHRAVTSLGVAAVSEVDGITNCGAGPGDPP